MKLAVISTMRGCQWAGSETVWHLAALLALQEGHEVTAMLHPDIAASTQVAEFVTKGGKVRSWKTASVPRMEPLRERLTPSFPATLLSGFDGVLVSLGSLPSLVYVPGLIKGLLDCRASVVLFCQFNSDHLGMSPHERAQVSRVIGASNSCVFLSKRNLDEARRQFAVEPPNAIILHNPTRDGVNSVLPWPSLKQGARFASVARFETAWKGQDMLLDVLRQPEWQARDWHLTFYGSGPDKEHIQNVVRLFGLGQHVTFAGFVNGLEDIWSNNHALVLPSYGEGLPLAALEAMMLGRLVVATDVGGNRELIDDGVTGFIADGATAYSFNQALERAWQVLNDWPEMGMRAHLRAWELAKQNPTKQLLAQWTGLPV